MLLLKTNSLRLRKLISLLCFSNNSALFLSASARSTIKPLSILSAFARWSAICCAILASFNASCPKFFKAFAPSFMAFVASLKLLPISLTPLFNWSNAPLISPLNNLPKVLANVSTTVIIFLIGNPTTSKLSYQMLLLT